MFEQTFKNIDDVLWKDAGCTSELDYTEQTSWLLFLKYLDALEQDKAAEAALEGKIKNMGNAGRNCGETICDPAVGSAGFLCEAFDQLQAANPQRSTTQDRVLQERNFYGEEKQSLLHQAFSGEL